MINPLPNGVFLGSTEYKALQWYFGNLATDETIGEASPEEINIALLNWRKWSGEAEEE